MTEPTETPVTLLKAKITLTLAEALTGVSYHTMYSANQAGRLGLIRTLCEENEKIEVLLLDLVDYMIMQAPEDQRWHPVWLPISKVVPKPGMQPRVKPNDVALIEEITHALKRGKAVEPVWVFRSGEHYFPADGHRRLASHIKAGRDEIGAVVIELPVQYAKPLAIAANSRHAKNLTVADVKALVIEQLLTTPEVVRKLLSREISANDYAKNDLGVSAATLSRALKTFQTTNRHVPAIQDVYQASFRYLQQLGEIPRLDPDDQLTASLVIHRALQTALEGIGPEVLKRHKLAVRNRDTEVGRLAPSLLLSLFDRRGGDRRAPN